jgi:hypothetical protein
MKKLFALSVLSAGLLLASTQQASAWSNIKFGVGMNLHWQTGDNNFLWGVFRNGQIPPPAGVPGGFPGGYPGGGFPQYYEPTGTGNGTAEPPSTTNSGGKQAVTNVPGATNVSQAGYPNNYGYGYYQPVGYYPNYSNYNPYQLPSYSSTYSTSNYYPYQVPSYWYGQ